MPARLLAALEQGIRTPLRARGRLGLAPRDVGRLELVVDRFFRFHIGIELRSTPFLRQVLTQGAVDASRARGDNAPALEGESAPDPGAPLEQG